MCKVVRNFSLASSMVVFLFTALLMGNGLSQETFPNRPITLVVQSGAGMSDTLTRIIAKPAEKELGQPIVIENKPGPQPIGMNYVLKSKPDGYTLGACVSSVFVIASHIRKVPYDILTDSIDITTFYKYNLSLAVRGDAPWNTLEDVIAYAKNNPGKFTYATGGVGVPQHICLERIAMKRAIKWTAVPFKSPAESVVACLGGHTDATTQSSVDILPHLKAGKLKLLVVLTDTRWPAYPNVPTVLESGFDFSAFSYGSINAPKGVPEPIIKRLEDAFNKSKKDPIFLEALQKFGVQESPMSGKEYTVFWKSQYEEMGKMVRALGLQEKK